MPHFTTKPDAQALTGAEKVWAAQTQGGTPTDVVTTVDAIAGRALSLAEFTEAVQDVVGALVSGAGGSYDDNAGTITLPAGAGGGLDAEGVRDTIAAALVGGSGITVTPNDGSDTITISSSGGGGVVGAGLTSLEALTGAGVVTATNTDTFDMRPIGVANGTDIPDRNSADTRWAQISAVNTAIATAKTVAVIAQKTANYTPVLADVGAVDVFEFISASALTMTIPLNATAAFAVGTTFILRRAGAGSLTVAGAGGVTLRSPGSFAARAQWSELSVQKRDTDEWVVSGDLA